jgi:hypothetical protein
MRPRRLRADDALKHPPEKLKEIATMTNREMFLLATTILFASTTAGMALQGVLHHGRPGFERMHGKPDGDRPDRGARMFEETDTNKDGFVTRDEMLAKQQARLDEMFTTVDTDKDGKLSRDEMQKGRELMRAKWKARLEAERKADGAPETAPVPAPAQ